MSTAHFLRGIAAPIAASTILFFGPGVARADDDAEPDGQPTSDAEPAPIAVEEQPFTPPPAPDDEAESGRLRIGFDLRGGTTTHAARPGPVFGTSFRVGYQANDLVAIYANLSSAVWVDKLSSDSAAQTSAHGITPMIGLTPVDALEIAAGPSLTLFSGGRVDGDAMTKSDALFTNAAFGLQGRVSLHLANRKPTGHRHGFTLGGDVQTVFVPSGPLAIFTLGLGYDWY